MTRLRPSPTHRRLAAALLFGGLYAHVQAAEQPQPQAQAQVQQAQLVDPTRPRSAVAPAPGNAPARNDSAAAPRVWPKLQAVQTPAQGEASAMIDGRIVRVGERVGDATLAAIGPHSIVLRNTHYEQHISLTPGINKTASAAGLATPNQPAVALATKETR